MKRSYRIFVAFFVFVAALVALGCNFSGTTSQTTPSAEVVLHNPGAIKSTAHRAKMLAKYILNKNNKSRFDKYKPSRTEGDNPVDTCWTQVKIDNKLYTVFVVDGGMLSMFVDDVPQTESFHYLVDSGTDGTINGGDIGGTTDKRFFDDMTVNGWRVYDDHNLHDQYQDEYNNAIYTLADHFDLLSQQDS